ncbi:MAG TPA: NAD(P)H-dependent oxidoreductase [Pseudomonadales bacterium]
MKRQLRLALVYGSTRTGRFCDVVARWAVTEIRRHEDFLLDVIDPAVPDERAGASIADRIDRADAIVIVTPEYNHSYPAPLKALIDGLSEEWNAKPVAFVCYGGQSGGIRAVEQLRLVFAELHAATVRDIVSFANAWEQFDEHGVLKDPARAQRAMAAMLGSLRWWASALRYARQVAPYRTRAA